MFYEQTHLVYNAIYVIPEKRKDDNKDLNT